MLTISAIQSWPKSKIRMVALCVGAIQTAFVTILVMSSGYLRDDYLLLLSGRKGGFSEAQLTHSVFGSLVPGFEFGFSALASLHPVPRWPAVFITVLLYAIVLFLFYRLAELLVGPRPVLIPLMAIAGLSGVLATSLVWWTAGLNSLPAVACDLLALDGLARHAITGKRRHLAVSIVSFAVGIAFFDPSASFAAVLVTFAAFYLIDLHNWRELVGGLVRRGWIWFGYAVPIILNVAWRSAHPGEYLLSPFPTIDQALNFLGAGWAQGYVPSALGFTYANVSQGLPRIFLEVVGQVLFFGIVFASIYRRRDAWMAWVMFGSGFAVLDVIAAIGRASEGTQIAGNTVYWTAQPFILSITVLLAFLPIRSGFAASSHEVTPRRLPHFEDFRIVILLGSAVLVLCAFGIDSMWTTPDRSQGALNRSYIQHLSTSWNQVQTKVSHPFVWNTIVPIFALGPIIDRVQVTAGVLINLRIDATSGEGYIVSDSGTLTPATRDVVSRAAIGELSPNSTLCFRRRTTAWTETVPLSASVPTGNWFLRLSYKRSSGFSTTIAEASVKLAKGSGEFLVPDSTSIAHPSLSLRIPAGASACIAAADFEAPVVRGNAVIGPSTPTQPAQ